MRNTVAVLVRDREKQSEALRTCVGLLDGMCEVQVFILDHEIDSSGAGIGDNLMILSQMDGERYTNRAENVDRYGFRMVTLDEIGGMLKEARQIIAF